MIENIAVITCSIVAWIIWGFGIVGLCAVIFDKVGGGDKFSDFMCIFLISGLLGLGFSIAGLITPMKDVKLSYEIPTSITKTNNFTFVNYVKDGECVIPPFVSGETKYWNSKDIMIEVTDGKNLYGVILSPKYAVTIHETEL